MKVFKLNEYDWWLAPSLEEAIEDCSKSYGTPKKEVAEKPQQLSYKEMGELIFKSDEAEDMTFAQRYYLIMSGESPQMGLFASTEF